MTAEQARPVCIFRPDVVRRIEEAPQILVQAVRACRRGESPWPLYAYGPPGTGKTCFGLLVVDYLGATLLAFLDALSDFREARCGRLRDERYIHQPHVSDKAYLDRLAGMELLVLDDIGAVVRADDVLGRELLLRILDGRVGKPAVYLGNLEPSRLLACYGDDRIVSRLTAGTVVHVAGECRRKFVQFKEAVK